MESLFEKNPLVEKILHARELLGWENLSDRR